MTHPLLTLRHCREHAQDRGVLVLQKDPQVFQNEINRGICMGIAKKRHV